jgi:hypothetical protein
MPDFTVSQRKKAVFKSTCMYYYASLIQKFEEKKIWGKTNQCTNHPMHCPFCPPSLQGILRTIWSYNLIHHAWIKHAVDGNMPNILPAFWKDSYISVAEESRFGILPELTHSCR